MLYAWAGWLNAADDSPIVRCTPDGEDRDAYFDVKVIYQQRHEDVDIMKGPEVFKPVVGPFQLTYLEKVYATLEGGDIFEERGIDRRGAVVVVRPDQYVAAVLPLSDSTALARFFEGNMLSA